MVARCRRQTSVTALSSERRDYRAKPPDFRPRVRRDSARGAKLVETMRPAQRSTDPFGDRKGAAPLLGAASSWLLRSGGFDQPK
jgi:hypothetical protein